MKTLPGKLSIIRHHNGEKPAARIHVRDDQARTNFLMIEVGAEELMQALMGRSEVDCVLQPKNLERVGTLMQTKIVHIDAPKDVVGYMSTQTEEAVTALLAPHETDGWIATRSDMTNIRRRCEGQKQAVTFCRWIAPE